MTAPIAAPKPVVTTSNKAKTASGCNPVSRSRTATKTPEKAITEPTLRSMPPDRITTVMPTATMPRYALSVRRLPITRVDSMNGN